MNERDKNTNPFVALADARKRNDAAGQAVAEAKISSFIKAAGTKAAAATAHSKGLRLDSTPIDPKEQHHG